ncbi:MAG TPA: modulator protein [Alphaproteobacteria bacterium]|nr:modulator protein [Alphaproteobacteria bacterium]
MKSNLELGIEIIERAKQKGADEADLVIAQSFDNSCRIRLGKLENIEVSETRDIGIRVLLKGKKGYKSAIISTNNFIDKNIDITLDRLIETAKISEEDEYTRLAEKGEYAEAAEDLEVFCDKEVTAETLKDWAKKCEDSALSVKGITNTEGADASYSQLNFALVSSKGFAQSYKNTGYSFSVSVIAENHDGMETDYDYCYVRQIADLMNPEIVGKSASEKAVKKLSPRKIKTCKVPVIFDPLVSKSLLSSLCSALNGSAISKKSSFLSDKMGQQILPENISVIDDPLFMRGLGSQPFDAEGIKGKKEFLVENGILKNWITDIRTAGKIGITSLGRASRSVSSPPSPSATNVYMQAGKRTPQEIISEIKEGLYLTDVFGMGVNGVTGDYSQGAAGFWIENGEIQYPVSEITVAGNLLEMLIRLEAANDLTFRYAKNAPTLKIDGMTIAGS